jgi:predicted permease
VLGLILAQPITLVASRYAARFSVRALEATVDTSVLWLGAGLALAAAILLAYVPRLPSHDRAAGLGLDSGTVRLTPVTNRRLRIFATTQIACSFVLLAGAGMLVATLTALQTADTTYDMRQVLAIDVPPSASGAGGEDMVDFFEEATRRVSELPGVEGVAGGMVVPWRDPSGGLKFQFSFEGYRPADGEEDPTCRLRPVSPRFFAVLGVPILAGRDFTYHDREGTELVAIVSQSVAQRLFPNGDAIGRRLWFSARRPQPRRIIGIVADVDDENVVQQPTMTVYLPFQQMGLPSRLFVRAEGDPYALVPSVTRTLREISADQAVERPTTLEDLRAEVLTPDRLNAFVFSAFGGIALLIAVVGVAGVLAFSVSARTRELGIRVAVGSTPSQLLTGVLKEGARIVTAGITAGFVLGYVLFRVASTYLGTARMPGLVPTIVAAVVLTTAAVVASLIPAARASRVDVLEALRTE